MPHKHKLSHNPDQTAWNRFRKKIGVNIKACRKAQGLYLEDLSELSGYPLTSILKLERGKGGLDLRMIFHLTRVLKVPTEMIFRV